MTANELPPLVPAKAGTQIGVIDWIPAYAGMSGREVDLTDLNTAAAVRVWRVGVLSEAMRSRRPEHEGGPRVRGRHDAPLFAVGYSHKPRNVRHAAVIDGKQKQAKPNGGDDTRDDKRPARLFDRRHKASGFRRITCQRENEKAQ